MSSFLLKIVSPASLFKADVAKRVVPQVNLPNRSIEDSRDQSLCLRSVFNFCVVDNANLVDLADCLFRTTPCGEEVQNFTDFDAFSTTGLDDAEAWTAIFVLEVEQLVGDANPLWRECPAEAREPRCVTDAYVSRRAKRSFMSGSLTSRPGGCPVGLRVVTNLLARSFYSGVDNNPASIPSLSDT